ncbi:MAG: hypothetical protein QM496_02715 [Verrucomicrobiota bacterium]
MWGKVGGKVKIDVAKEVMAELVPSLDPSVKIGLMAYGHRRKGDCSDIEVLIPPGSNDRTALLKQVQDIVPKGKTPISDAVVAAAELLKTKEIETTIVLVSDGIETCATDPCDVVRKLKQTGIKFVLHVVGLGVDSKAKEQLDCMAKAGGGKYFDAGDKAQLLGALKTVQEEVKVKLEEAKTQKKTAATGLPKIILKQPETAVKGMAGFRIVKADGSPLKEAGQQPALSNHPLPPGKYTVEYLFATPNYGASTVTKLGQVELEMGQTKELNLGSIAFNVPKELSKSGASYAKSVLIVEAGSGETVVTVNNAGNGAYNLVPKAVLPGIYDVMFHYSWSPDPTTVARNVVVEAGKETTITLSSAFSFTKPKNTALEAYDLIPIDSGIAANSDEDESKIRIKAVLQGRPRFGSKDPLYYFYIVPPGKYKLNATIKGMAEPLTIAPELEIKVGESLEFDSGL